MNSLGTQVEDGEMYQAVLRDWIVVVSAWLNMKVHNRVAEDGEVRKYPRCGRKMLEIRCAKYKACGVEEGLDSA